MANYFQVTNANGNLLIDDESNVMQILGITKKMNITTSAVNTFNTLDGWKAISKYYASFLIYATDETNDVYGNKKGLKVGAVNTLYAFRIFGDISNPPYCQIAGGKYGDDVSRAMTISAYGLVDSSFQAQVAWISLDPYDEPTPNTPLVVYGADGKITFDAALGYVHHLATVNTRFNVQGQSSNFTIKVMDLSGLGLDYSKLFFSMPISVPRVSQWQGSGNAFRVGYRSFIPRLRVTDNILYVDFGIFMPYNYTGNIAAVYYPSYYFHIFYLPNVREG